MPFCAVILEISLSLHRRSQICRAARLKGINAWFNCAFGASISFIVNGLVHLAELSDCEGKVTWELCGGRFGETESVVQ